MTDAATPAEPTRPDPSTQGSSDDDPSSEEPSGPPPLRDQLARWWPGWRDVACLVLLVTATFHLVSNDGGRPLRPMLPLLVLSAVAMVATIPTLKRSPRWLQLIALAWVAGPLISLIFADVRAGWVRPVAAWAIAVPLALATLHLLRRRWGATAITAIVALALGLAWYNGFLIWWGGGTSRGEPAWMALSWHNQSGTLMAVLGVGGLGVALARIGWPRVVGVIAATAGLSATWLSGSRGAVLTALVAVTIVLAISARRPRTDGSSSPIRVTSIVAGIVAGLTIAAVLSMGPLWLGSTSGIEGAAANPAGIPSQPITAREQDAAGNLRARFGHWEAAVRMFAASPLTGTGPGSYQWSSRPVYPEETNLTSSAHGEQLEALGELGLVGGGAALAVTFGLAWLVVGSLRRPGAHPLEIPAAGVAVLLTSHAALDFDWDYPLLLALLAVAAATLVTARGSVPGLLPSGEDVAQSAERAGPHDHGVASEAVAHADPAGSDPPEPSDHRAMPADQVEPADDGAARATGHVLVAATVTLALLLVSAGTAGIVLQQRGIGPWILDSRIIGAVTAAAYGDRPAVEERVDALTTWNPGSPRLDDVIALAHHGLGDLPSEELASTFDPERSSFADQLQGASQLVAAGDPDLALEVVEAARPVIDRRRAWGIIHWVARAASIELAAHHDLGGCDAVTDAWPEVEAWLADYGLGGDALSDEPVDLTTETPEPAAWRACDLTMPRGG